MSIRIVFLADYPEHIAQVAYWQWHEWDRDMLQLTLDEVTDLIRQHSLHTEQLDINLIALDDTNQCVGTIELAGNEFLPGYETVEPWLGSLYVAEAWRGQGIARLLMQAAIERARQLSFPTLYMFTHTLDALVQTYGGQYQETIPFANEEWRVYTMDLS